MRFRTKRVKSGVVIAIVCAIVLIAVNFVAPVVSAWFYTYPGNYLDDQTLPPAGQPLDGWASALAKDPNQGIPGSYIGLSEGPIEIHWFDQHHLIGFGIEYTLIVVTPAQPAGGDMLMAQIWIQLWDISHTQSLVDAATVSMVIPTDTGPMGKGAFIEQGYLYVWLDTEEELYIPGMIFELRVHAASYTNLGGVDWIETSSEYKVGTYIVV